MKLRLLSILITLALIPSFISIPAKAYNHASATDIGTAIDAGVAWLAAQQDGDGSWHTAYQIGETALALIKLEDYAWEKYHISPLDPAYIYHDNVTRGLGYLFSWATVTPITGQTAGNPDWNGNGYGVYFSPGIYETSIAMMAVASSRSPTTPVTISGQTMTYQNALQDTAEYLAYAQGDVSQGRGGWRYTANDSNGNGDNSVSGWAVIALLYAENPLYGFNCTIPQFVRDELCTYWIPYIQDYNPVTNIGDGGSGYSVSWDWKNTLKTGNLLCELAFVGSTQSNQRTQKALSYIRNHWYDNTLTQGWGWNYTAGTGKAFYQATYCLMKGLQTMGVADTGMSPDIANWYGDMADVIVDQQNKNTSSADYGSWSDSYTEVEASGYPDPAHMADKVLCTAWALLTLERTSPPSPCGDNCTCMEDPTAASCNFTACNNIITACGNTAMTACSDNVPKHCYTCPQGCECLSSANTTGLQECVTGNCSYNPCPPGEKCYTQGCECGGWNPVKVTWSGSSLGTWTGHCGDNLTLPSSVLNTPITITTSENCTAGCTLTENWTIINSLGIPVVSTGSGNNASFTPTAADNYTVTFTSACGSVPNITVCPPCSIQIYITGCGCQPWDNGTISWIDINNQTQQLSTQCGSPITVSPWHPGTAITENSTISCGPGCQPTYSFAVEDSSGNSVQSQTNPNTPGIVSFIPHFTGTSATYTVYENATCGNQICQCVTPIEVDCPCACSWLPDNVTVSWTDSIGVLQTAFPYCGENVTVSLQIGSNSAIQVTAPGYNCAPSPLVCKGGMYWNVKNPVGLQIATGNQNQLPVIFTPTATGDYTVTFSGDCDCSICPDCVITIHVVPCPCECQGYDNVTVSCPALAAPLTGHCGDNLTVPCSALNTPITITATENCSAGCPLTENWTITNSFGFNVPPSPGSGNFASFTPTVADNYTVTFNATCGSGTDIIVCPPCYIHIQIGQGGCQCQSWSAGSLSWTDSSGLAQTMPSSIVTGPNPIYIPSIQLGTQIVENSTICCSPGCSPTYSWQVRDQANNIVAQQQNSWPVKFNAATGTEIYTVYENATCSSVCDNVSCPPRIINIVTQCDCGTCLQDTLAQPPYNYVHCDNITQNCGAWFAGTHCYICALGCQCLDPANASGWQECAAFPPPTNIVSGQPCPNGQKCYRPVPQCVCQGYDNVTVSGALAAPLIGHCNDNLTVPCSVLNTPITITASENCSAGCPLTENWTITNSLGANMPPSPGSGNTATFTPTVAGNYTVTFYATCGSGSNIVVCDPCSIQIQIPACTCQGWSLATATWNDALNTPHQWSQATPGSDLTLTSIYPGSQIHVTATENCSAGCPLSENWTLYSPGPTITGPGTTADFITPTPGPYVIKFNAMCGCITCPTMTVTIKYVPPGCICESWDNMTVSWRDAVTGGWSLTQNCGDNVTINVLDACTDVKVISGGVNCSTGCSPSNYSWSVADLSGGSGTVLWSGPGLTAQFKPITDSPTTAPFHEYLVTFNASCDGTLCTCNIRIRINSTECTCHPRKFYNNPTVTWTSNNALQSWHGQVGDQLVIQSIDTGHPINVAPNFYTGWCSSGTPTYIWHVAGATVDTGTGANVEFMPQPSPNNPVTGVQVYTVTWDVTCDNCTCPDACSLTIDLPYGIAPHSGTETEKTLPPCQDWNQSTYSWIGSSPGTWTGPCGGGATPAIIESVNAGTPVQVSSTVTCNSPDVQPTYAWSITSSSGATLASGNGPTAAFIPVSPGSYTAIFSASCGGTACQSTCSIPIQINNVKPRAMGPVVVFPFTCACGTWSPAIVTWPDGSQTVSCTPAAALPSVSIPSLTPGSAVQISSSAACGPGILNFFTGEACPASENWTVTSTFSGQGPWSGSGSTASFIPDKEGSFIVAFKASCGSAACPTPCKIHIDVKSMGQEGGGQPPSGAPVIISFTPSRTQVSPKEPVTLNWVIKGTGEATLECGGEKSTVPFTGSSVINPSQSGCCTLTAGNKYGSDQKTACITVSSTKESPPHINSFTASSTQVYAGDRVVLNWSISGDGEAYLTCGGEKRQVPFTGSSVISPTQSGCCTLSANNKAGSDQESACISILHPKVTPPKETPPKPTAPVINNFSASCPKESFAAIACTLNWSVTGPSGTTVTISGLGSVGMSGSTQVKYGGSYTLTASSAGGSATRTVTVK